LGEAKERPVSQKSQLNNSMNLCYTSTMQSGVFLFLLLLLTIAGILLLLVLKNKPGQVYKPKGPYLLSPGEARFFDALTHSVPESFYICPKVRIADLIETNREQSDPLFWQEQRRINQKHVDFVLCRRSDFAPVAAIELDGGSHNDPKRLARDQFIDSVFSSANIPLLHIPVQGFYHYAAIRDLVVAATGGRGS
jgi:Protein of unknown function (DUF2726)